MCQQHAKTLHQWTNTHIGSVPWVGGLEGPRDLDNWRGRLGARSARNVDLGAADVELRRAAWVVDAE
jgi:hypothetical protein